MCAREKSKYSQDARDPTDCFVEFLVSDFPNQIHEILFLRNEMNLSISSRPRVLSDFRYRSSLRRIFVQKTTKKIDQGIGKMTRIFRSVIERRQKKNFSQKRRIWERKASLVSLISSLGKPARVSRTSRITLPPSLRLQSEMRSELESTEWIR